LRGHGVGELGLVLLDLVFADFGDGVGIVGRTNGVRRKPLRRFVHKAFVGAVKQDGAGGLVGLVEETPDGRAA
jgi:hypothetical protein